MPKLRINDAELNYGDVGQGEPVLLLHGLGSAGDDWQPQIDVLKAKYRIISPDDRGSGESRDLLHPGGPFSMKQFAADAAALLDRLGAAPAHVIGLSLGGMVSFQLAVDWPKSVRSLCIINSAPAVVPKTLPEHFKVLTRRTLAGLLGPRRTGMFLAPKLFPKAEHESLRTAFIERMTKNEKPAYVATLEAIIGWSVQDRIHQITVPTLIVASDRDYTPVSAKDEYAKFMPNAKVVVVSDSHHALPVEAPDKLNPILLDHLARNAAK